MEKKTLKTEYPLIAAEWDYNKNDGLTPEEFAPHSNKVVWWICKNGHEFSCSIDKRTGRNQSCPYCSGKRIMAGFNDLATVFPALASEWIDEKNGSLTPAQIAPHSNKYAWWRCSNCAHEWRAKINDRANGRGCPLCAKQRRVDSTRKSNVIPGKNDVATLFPAIASEWNDTENEGKKPSAYSPNSGELIWWICSMGHSWQASIKNRTARGSGCPYCAHKRAIPGETDLQTRFPEIAQQWDYEKNGDLLPSMVLPFSNKKVWWKCEKGHSWQTKIELRVTQSSGCPTCALRSHTSFPEQAIYYYLSKQVEVISRSKIAGWEVDILLPAFDVGIEYDGIVFHSRKPDVDRETRKNNDLAKAGIDLIRVKETKDKAGTTDNTVFFPYAQQYKYLNEALVRLFVLLSDKTGLDLSSDVDVIRDRKDIQQQYLFSESKRNVREAFPDVAAEWDFEKNGHLRPEFFSYGSQERVWWKCSACGYEWQTAISNRTSGHSMCPKCAARLAGEKQQATRLRKKKNGLVSVAPALLSEWDYEKNEKPPQDYSSGSRKNVWWICSTCGHKWEAPVYLRVKGFLCPMCRKEEKAKTFRKNKLRQGENDLLSRFPDIAKEWDFEKNSLSPSSVLFSSHVNFGWICPLGHRYEAPPNRRTSLGTGCPYCAGKKVLPGFNDLASTHPELLMEWDYEKNKEVDPAEITPGKSSQKYWWKCSACGHEWQASPNTRTRGHGCPVCAKSRHT